MRIKTPSLSTKIRSLSGGNQQKVIIGRWLLTEPEIFLMDEPTRGIDVGAKYEIYQIIIDMAREGKSVIMVSSEMLELLGVRAIRLMTNNPAKVSSLEAEGVVVSERVAHQLPPNPHNARYLDTKRDRTGHLLK